jgi:hypothetical protein
MLRDRRRDCGADPEGPTSSHTSGRRILSRRRDMSLKLRSKPLLALAGTTAAAFLLAVSGASSNGPLTGSISVTCSLGQCDSNDTGWACRSPVDLDSVKINVDVPRGSSGRAIDALHLASGCTGRIGKVTITTISGDGIKVGDGAHDLVVGGGSITCNGHPNGKHQDGIQAMGGSHITFAGLTVNCASANNAQFFVSWNAQDPTPHPYPSDILFVHGVIHPDPTHYHGVTLAVSNRSGVIDSVICPSSSPSLTYQDDDATDPVNLNNTFPASC